jgi:hypothetical protein
MFELKEKLMSKRVNYKNPQLHYPLKELNSLSLGGEYIHNN